MSVADELLEKVRTISDFPKRGITFYDITTLLQDARAFQTLIDLLADRWIGDRPDYVVGIDARGFLLAGALGYKLDAGVVMVRKQGKLPFRTESVRYELEYGQAEIEIHADAVEPGKRVLIVDDLLATGGTAQATVDLVRRTGGTVLGCDFIIELSALKGRERLTQLDVPVFAAMMVDG